MSATTPLLHVERLSKAFKGQGPVLDGITFDLFKQEVKMIIGPSGSGKSTLLQCINFLLPYDSGRVVLDDILVEERNKNECRQEIGFVFQHFNLFAHLNALDNVTLGPTTVKGKGSGAARESAYDLLERVGLGEKASSYPAQLSGGQKQRLGIARALAMQPKLILFDEPTSALDPELIGDVLAVIEELAKEGTTMLIVTHEMGFAQAFSDEIIFMENGRIIEQGSPMQFSNPTHARTQQFLQRYNER